VTGDAIVRQDAYLRLTIRGGSAAEQHNSRRDGPFGAENGLEESCPRFECGSLLTAVRVQVVVTSRNAGLRVVQDFGNDVFGYAGVSHHCRGGPAKVMSREAEAGARSTPLHSLLNLKVRTTRLARTRTRLRVAQSEFS